MKKLQYIKYFPIVLILIFLVSACGKSEDVRNYTEEPVNTTQVDNLKIHGNVPEMKAPNDIKWNTPSGWESVKSDSRMRIATFSVKSGNEAALCTLIPLRGDGGGLAPNVNMWYSALTGEKPVEKKLGEFLKEQKKFKTSTGFDGILIDFLGVSSKEGKNSMLVSVITLNNRTLFIKFSGSKKIIENNRNKFLALSKSIRLSK